MEPRLMKLAEYNREVRETFTIGESKADDDQYFVMYGMESEGFNPERVHGVWGAEEVASMMAYFRQTGILRLRSPWSHPYRPQYEYVQPDWVYFLKADHIMSKQKHFEEVRVPKD